MADPHTRTGWKNTMARRAVLASVGDKVKCVTCGDVGFIIDPTKRPASVACPDCTDAAADLDGNQTAAPNPFAGTVRWTKRSRPRHRGW
jgi:hypothetical protein